MKNAPPVIPFPERLQIVAALKDVDRVVPDVSQDKRLAWESNRFDILFKGTDWQGTPKGFRLEQELAEIGVMAQSTNKICFKIKEINTKPADSGHIPVRRNA